MIDSRPRPERYLGELRAFFVEHRRTLAVDVGVITAWALLLLAIVVVGRLPSEVLYVGLFAGVLSYSLIAGWREPARAD